MTPTIRMNFASDAEFASKLWSCPGCSEDKSVYSKVEGFRDTQSHVMVCAGYSDLREGKDLNTDKDLVKYFQMVIKKRIDLLELSFKTTHQGAAGHSRGRYQSLKTVLVLTFMLYVDCFTTTTCYEDSLNAFILLPRRRLSTLKACWDQNCSLYYLLYLNNYEFKKLSIHCTIVSQRVLLCSTCNSCLCHSIPQIFICIKFIIKGLHILKKLNGGEF